MIYHRMSSIFLYKKAEVFLLPFFFARKQLPFSQHRLSEGCTNCARGSSFPGGSFSAPADRGTRTAAGVFAPDGRGFFAEPQRGVALCGARRFAVPTARGKRVDTYGFYPLNSRFPLFLSLAQIADM